MIRADATKLRQCIFNLLSNAAKFTQNGRITLSVSKFRKGEEDWIAIAVADTGVGISKDQQSALFSNFSQANPAITAKYGGTGLGLSLSQNLCHIMGGFIELESELGKGSRFTIRLPAGNLGAAADDELLEAAIADNNERAKGHAGLSMPAVGSVRQEKILLVDDDRAFLELAERLLLKEGYSPISTDAPESVLQLARAVRPAAIFVDILMPGLNGWDVLSTLKADPATASIPVVMLSVLDDQQTARDQGAALLMTKPLDGNKLRGLLEQLREEPAAQARKAG